MSGRCGRDRRILAIDPTHRGFGFVVLEGPSRLLDWGVKDVRGNRDEGTLAKVRDLIDTYRPHVLVAEDCDDRSARRGPRVARLISEVLALTREQNIRTRTVAARVAHQRLVPRGKPTKSMVAKAIVVRFPELTWCRPPERKLWMSEDARQAIFDAAGFALVLIRDRSGQPDGATGSRDILEAP